MSVISGSMGHYYNKQNERCAHGEDEPTVDCIALPGLVERGCEYGVQAFCRRTRPCLWVAQRQESLYHRGKVVDHDQFCSNTTSRF